MLVTCYNCFQQHRDRGTFCPFCGFDSATAKREPNHLPRGTVLQDRYLIGEVCGFGGFGITYKAWDKQLETIVAIKEFFPNGSVNRIPGTENLVLFTGNRRKEYEAGLARFIEEARTTAKFSSNKNIVTVTSYFEANKTAYIVMEFLDGITLETYLQQFNETGDCMEIDSAVEITLSICEALKTIHANGVIHRDISPDNIYLCYNGATKLYDFGAARISRDESRMLTIILKPGYAPPEQYEKVNMQGPWTDIYALGATLYRMVTGVKPIESMNRKIKDELKEPMTLNPLVPQDLNDIIMKAMAIEHGLRFQTVDELEAVLQKKKPVVSLHKTIKRKKRRRILSIAAAAALVLTGGGIFGYKMYQNYLETVLPEATIDVWYLTDDKAKAAALEDIKKDFCAEYEKVTINLVGVSEKQFESQLKDAKESGTMPALFQSDQIKANDYPVLQLKPTMDNLDLNSYYYLADNQLSILSENKMPLGFNVPVYYINTAQITPNSNIVRDPEALTGDDSPLPVDIEIKSLLEKPLKNLRYSAVSAEQFYQNEVPALLSDSSVFYDVQQKKRADYQILATDGNLMIGTAENCWSLGDTGDKDQERVARRFLEYMLSDNAQDKFYLRNRVRALPINKTLYTTYLSIYKDFAGAVQQPQLYDFYFK